MRRTPPKNFKKTPAHSQNLLLKKSIFNTLKYRQIFNCPMSVFQIWNYLIGNHKYEPKNFQRELLELVKSGEIICQDGLYSLQKVDYENNEKKLKRAHKLIMRAYKVSSYLKQIPWIEMIAVTGSVAAYNAEEQSDIDIFVVTQPKRLFLTRFFMVTILKALGVYWDQKKPSGTICPNIIISSNNLTWNGKNQNLYTANEISLLYPIFYRNNCYFSFLKHNEWAKNYLPNLQISELSPVLIKRLGLSRLIDFMELLAMKFQIGYMKKKKTTELVSKNILHFNSHDSSEAILHKYGLQ